MPKYSIWIVTTIVAAFVVFAFVKYIGMCPDPIKVEKSKPEKVTRCGPSYQRKNMPKRRCLEDRQKDIERAFKDYIIRKTEAEVERITKEALAKKEAEVKDKTEYVFNSE